MTTNVPAHGMIATTVQAITRSLGLKHQTSKQTAGDIKLHTTGCSPVGYSDIMLVQCFATVAQAQERAILQAVCFCNITDEELLAWTTLGLCHHKVLKLHCILPAMVIGLAPKSSLDLRPKAHWTYAQKLLVHDSCGSKHT